MAKSSLLQYRQAVKSPPPFALQQKQRSFLTFGFGAGPARRESHVNVNVTPTSHDLASDTPEIRKYKKRFNSEILCAALWGIQFTKVSPILLNPPKCRMPNFLSPCRSESVNRNRERSNAAR